jgi:hypothetical protein
MGKTLIKQKQTEVKFDNVSTYTYANATYLLEKTTIIPKCTLIQLEDATTPVTVDLNQMEDGVIHTVMVDNPNSSTVNVKFNLNEAIQYTGQFPLNSGKSRVWQFIYLGGKLNYWLAAQSL